MQTKLKIFKCPKHKYDEIKRVRLDSSHEKILYCIECLMDEPDESTRKTLILLEDALKTICESIKNYNPSTINEKPPHSLSDILDQREELVEKFTQHIKSQKEYLTQQLSSLSSEKANPLIEKFSKLLDDQIEIYSQNFDLYKEGLDKIFTPDGAKGIEKVTLEELANEINQCQHVNDLDETIRKFLLLYEEASKFGNKSETDLLQYAKGLNYQFTLALENQPQIVVAKNIEELISSGTQVENDLVTIDRPAERYDIMSNSRILTRKDLDKIIKLACPNFKGKATMKLVERASADGKNVPSIIKQFNTQSNHLIVVRSDKGRTRGAITCLDDNSKSKIFDLEKELVMDNKTAPTSEVGFYFVGEYLIFISDKESTPTNELMTMLTSKGMNVDFKNHLGLVGSPIEHGQNEPKTPEELDKVFWHFDQIELLEMKQI